MQNINNKEEITIDFPNNSLVAIIVGNHNLNLTKLEKLLDVNINLFGNQFNISGESKKIQITKTIINNVYTKLSNKKINKLNLNFMEFETEFRMLAGKSSSNFDLNDHQVINQDKLVTWKKHIFPKSIGQKKYLNALNNYELVFGLGPAGTGKSYLAVAKGIDMLKKGLVEKIILTRPAVEAGERLGFLPGDMKEKIDPYLRPIYDALYEMMPSDRVEKKIQSGEIEIAPLAFMRGRTFTNSYVIVDEAQNTTSVQMKMVLTRIGEGSRMVINGDLSQVDLPKGQMSGLKESQKILNKIEDIKLIYLEASDVIRHPIVAKIIKAYDNINKDLQ
ncbi:PhoH family protein [Candidatus Levibacter sp. Uisw_134_01]|uniref:PhoH family protein n=1 Tax=Candidatus Levibacter sp. Uisw_134_01 TaxID=3230999 RepID=UPI003D5564E1